MAYAFDKVQDLLNPNKGFALAEDSNQQGQAPGLSSSTSGDIAPPSGSGSSSTTYQAQPSTAASARGVLSKNKGQTKSPIDTEKLKTGIGQATTSLKNEADTYTASATRPYEEYTDTSGKTQKYYDTPGVPTAGLKDLVSGYINTGSARPRGVEPYPGITDEPDTWYELATSAPLDPGAFKPTTSTDFRGVSDLQSGAGGIRNLFQSSGGARYTPGMASMDTSLLLQDPRFATAAEEVTKSAGGLKKYEADLLDSAPKEARKKVGIAQRDFKDSISSAARAEGTALTDAQRAEVTAPVKYTDYTPQAPTIKSQLIADNPEWADYINSLGEEGFKDLIRKATKPGSRSSLNWEDYIDSDEAEKFNRIEGLLGSGKTYVKGNRGGKDSEFDMEALKGMMKTGASGYKKPIVDNLPPPSGQQGSGGAINPEDNEYVPVEGEGTSPSPAWSGDKPDWVKKGQEFLDETMPFSPKNIERTNDIISGIVNSYTNPAAIAPPSSMSFPNVQGILGGGKSSTYEGKIDPSMIAGQVNLPTLEPVNNAPVQPNTPTIDFGGGYGSANAGTPDKPKTPEKKKKIKVFGHTYYI